MRRVLVFSGNRAEFGLLQLIVSRMRGDPRLSPVVAISGALADPMWGGFREQLQDGNQVDHILEVGARGLDGAGVCAVIGDLVARVGALIARDRPDVLLVLGDRFETLAATLAAHYHNVVIAHIHGGDRVLTDCRDNNVRHAISKLANLHFVACADSRDRLERMGESADRIHLVGSPAAEIVRASPLLDPAETRFRLGLGDGEPFCLVTMHPENVDAATNLRYQQSLLEGLEAAAMTAVITYPNNDPGGDAMIAALEAARTPYRTILRASLGMRLYLSALRDCVFVAGNSSSGIIETGLFHKPTIDCGGRQRGRVCGPNVIRCETFGREEVARAVRHALTPEFRNLAAAAPSPYDIGDTSRMICDTMAAVPLGDDLRLKPITY